MENSKTIVVFGAGSGCKKYIKDNSVNNKNMIIVDNNKNLHGSTVEGIKVESLNDIKNEIVEKVIITVSDISSVEEQLENQGIETSKFVYPAKSELAKGCFEDKIERKKIINNLIAWIDNIDKFGVKLLLEFGTALGMHRDAELIPWDNDIDLSIKDVDVSRLKEIITKKIILNTSLKSIMTKNGLQLSCDVSGIVCPVNIDVRETVKIKSISSGGKIAEMDKSIIYPERCIQTSQGTYYMPNNTVRYLEEIYGENWSKPRKNFSFKDYEKY